MIKINGPSYFTLTFIVFGVNGVLGLARLLLYASLLGPSEFGLFSVGQLMITVGAYISTLGFVEALNRQVPILLGERKRHRAHYFLSLGFGFSLLIASVLSVIFYIIVSSGFYLMSYGAIKIVGVLLVSTVFFNLVLAGIRGKTLTLEAGSLILAKTIMASVGSVLLAEDYGVSGVIFSEALALSVFSLYGWRRYLPGVFPIIRKKGHYLSIIAIGLPFLINNIVLNLSQTVDSWFAQWAHSEELYGQYAFAMIIFIAGQNFIGIIVQYIQPRVFTEYGKTKDHSKLLVYLHWVSLVIALLFILGGAPFYFLLEYILNSFYQEYKAVLDFSLFIYAGSGAMGVLGIYESYILARKRGVLLMKYYLFVLVFISLSCWWAALNNFGLVEYSIIFCLGRFMCLIIVMSLNKYLVSRQ